MKESLVGSRIDANKRPLLGRFISGVARTIFEMQTGMTPEELQSQQRASEVPVNLNNLPQP
jgi:hypothetical protein